MNVQYSKNLAQVIRRSSLQMVERAKASHIGSALSIADIVAVLYGQVLNIYPSDPQNSLRDRFILSKGHACVAVYSALAAKGFISEEELLTYGQDFSNLMNHISHKVDGVEFSTGSLGHGLPFGVGKALAANRLGKDWRTFVLLSDGELGEGSNWEAAMFAGHHKLNNLVAIIDYNNLQSLTTVEEALSIEPLADKWRSFGWNVIDVNGHDHNQLASAFKKDDSIKKPTVVIAHTVKGKGVSFMENAVAWHYKSPSKEELQIALEEIDNA